MLRKGGELQARIKRVLGPYIRAPRRRHLIEIWIERMSRACFGRIMLFILACESSVDNLEDTKTAFETLLMQISRIMGRRFFLRLRCPHAKRILEEALEKKPGLVCNGKPATDICRSSSMISEGYAQEICQQLTNISFKDAESMEDIIDFLARRGYSPVDIPPGVSVSSNRSVLWWVTKSSEVDNKVRKHRRGTPELAAELRDDLGLSQWWTGSHMYELRVNPRFLASSLRRATVFDTAFKNPLFRPCDSEACGGWGTAINARTLSNGMPEAIIVKPSHFASDSWFYYVGEVVKDKPPVDMNVLETELSTYAATMGV